MGKLTKEREAELLKLYPDGEDIGRAVIQDMIDDKKAADASRQYTHVLTLEELTFLQGTLKTNEDIAIYREYLGLQEALVKVKNMILLFQESFFHGLFRVLYLVWPLKMGLGAYCATPDLDNPDYKKTCEAHIKLTDGIETVWKRYVFTPLMTLYRYDFYLKLLNKLSESGFDYSVFCPNMSMYEQETKALQDEVSQVLRCIEVYNQAMGKKKTKIRIPQDLVKSLKQIAGGSLDEAKPTKTMVDAGKFFTSERVATTMFFDRFFLNRMMGIIHGKL